MEDNLPITIEKNTCLPFMPNFISAGESIKKVNRKTTVLTDDGTYTCNEIVEKNKYTLFVNKSRKNF